MKTMPVSIRRIGPPVRRVINALLVMSGLILGPRIALAEDPVAAAMPGKP